MPRLRFICGEFAYVPLFSSADSAAVGVWPDVGAGVIGFGHLADWSSNNESDGDGYGDLIETKLGSDPADKASTPENSVVRPITPDYGLVTAPDAGHLP